jgi:hypothetical protein
MQATGDAGRHFLDIEYPTATNYSDIHRTLSTAPHPQTMPQYFRYTFSTTPSGTGVFEKAQLMNSYRSRSKVNQCEEKVVVKIYNMEACTSHHAISLHTILRAAVIAGRTDQ